jgi:hypothetical protein
MAKKQNKVQPVEEVRIGSIKAAIWRNEGESGPRFNITLQRLYRTEDGKWQSTSSFGRDDLLVLMKVADATHTRVMELIGDNREQQRQEKPAARSDHNIFSYPAGRSVPRPGFFMFRTDAHSRKFGKRNAAAPCPEPREPMPVARGEKR